MVRTDAATGGAEVSNDRTTETTTRTDAEINAMASRSRLMRQLDEQDEARHRAKRQPPSAGAVPADAPRPRKPVLGAETLL